jgi:hypothetical protein
MAIPFLSAPTRINGQRSLYYELHLTNYDKDPIELGELKLLDADDSSIVDRFDHTTLAAHFAAIGQAKQGTRLILPPGGTAVVFMEISLPGTRKTLRLVHQMDLTIEKDGGSANSVVRGGTIQIAQNSPLVVAPPLRGGPWAAIYNSLWPTGHRRVFYTIGGTARLPGRYAIDFIKLDNAGRYARGDEDSIRNWLGYCAGVYAVADGVVASIRTDAAESNTLSAYTPASPENATGNYVSIRIAEDRFAFYEHLKPGSIRVKPGQKVKKGELIAELGFTGQTTGPHLHFHIANADSPLGAESIPFELESFRLIGSYPDLESFGKQRWQEAQKGSQPKNITAEHPGPQSVIDFGAN